MQVNQPEGGSEEATTNLLTVGDRVSYLQVRAERHGYGFSAREGVIATIDGKVATVRTENGRHITQRIDRLTPEGQPNALSRVLAGGQWP
ncbi:hypothetical protein [Pseudomonas fluorescens]|uniref:Uncharacterized protein n=1 Tax=Pseudomonas fluorescens TaxID=294 RepID=A0A5E7VLT9_PSEFL|nr:hypothetical protein [Pseudomonas fluorescens]VVQ23761.1 hypothetical protein PS941_05625 [Pseudomonas fluorescens]